MNPTPPQPAPDDKSVLAQLAEQLGHAADQGAKRNRALLAANAHDPKFRLALRASLPNLSEDEFARFLGGEVDSPAMVQAALETAAHDPSTN